MQPKEIKKTGISISKDLYDMSVELAEKNDCTFSRLVAVSLRYYIKRSGDNEGLPIIGDAALSTLLKLSKSSGLAAGALIDGLIFALEKYYEKNRSITFPLRIASNRNIQSCCVPKNDSDTHL